MITIAMDSTAYLTRQEARDLGVILIPMVYTVSNESFHETILSEADLETVAAAPEEDLYTSQPALGAFIRRFKRLVDGGGQVLCLTISSRLSGTYNNAKVCAREFGDKIRVVDSQITAGGLYLMAKEARRLINEGLGLDQVGDALEKYRERIFTQFSVAELAPLRRSGRLGVVRQSIGTVLNQRPIFTIKKGAIVFHDSARGKNDQLRKLAQDVPDTASEVAVQYYQDLEAARDLAGRLEKRLGVSVPLRRMGIVLGIHLGLDVVATVWVE